MSTIYDVAERAGVSAATVSRYMNGRSVREDAAGRIQAAVDELKYSPSRTARSLRTQSAQVIALVIPDIENPYFTAIARGAEDEAREAGYSLVLCNTDDDAGRESGYVDVVVSENMAGAIVAPATDGAAFSALAEQHRPLVAVDRRLGDDRTDSVTLDDTGFGERAVRELVQRGSRRIACITGPDRAETARSRAEGWRRALGDAADPALLRWADYRVAGGRAAMRDLLDGTAGEPIDGVVVANNLMAVGALAELRARGLTPGAVTVAMIGTLPYVEDPVEGVVSLPLPAREAGRTAARLLLSRIGGDRDAPEHVVLGMAGE